MLQSRGSAKSACKSGGPVELDLESLRLTLEKSGFQDRERIADKVAFAADNKEMVAITAWLVHDLESVRLGTIAILEAREFRPALGALGAIVRGKDGDEQVFALRALARMAHPDDKEKLQPVVDFALSSGNSFLQTQGKSLQAKLEGTVTATPKVSDVSAAASSSTPMTPAELTWGLTSSVQSKRRESMVRTLKHHPTPHVALADAMLDADSAGVRLDLVTGLGTLPPAQVVPASIKLFIAGNDDDAALVARMCVRKLTDVDAPLKNALAKAMTQARQRFLQKPLTLAALDHGLVVFGDVDAWASLAQRADSLELDVAQDLAGKLLDVDGRAFGQVVGHLMEALERAPRRVGVFAQLLLQKFDDMRGATQRALDKVVHRAVNAPDPDAELPPFAQGMTTLFAKLTRPQRPLPMRLVNTLEHSGEAADADALIALYVALGSEEAAERLVELSKDGDVGIRERALQALESFPTYEVLVEVDDDGDVHLICNFTTADGKSLTPKPDGFVDDTGRLFLLDADGQLVEKQSTPFGGCACCHRPRVLRIPPGMDGKERPRCPQTLQPHLIGEHGPLLESKSEFGGCQACSTVRPLVKMDESSSSSVSVVCPVCNTRHRREKKAGQVVYVPIKRRSAGHDSSRPSSPPSTSTTTQQATQPPAEAERPPRAEELTVDMVRERLPKPPSAGDLQLIEPKIAAAMNANVFVFGGVGEKIWTGSGVIIDREGDELLVLTNKHVIEDVTERGERRKARLFACLIDGQIVEAKILWDASEWETDVALLTLVVQNASNYHPMSLGDGACLVGSKLFAIGNMHGLAWSYTTGHLSGFRSFKTERGHDVKVLQTQIQLGGGSSGGGMYHDNGHLVGLVSFFHPGGRLTDTPVEFSMSMELIKDVLRREAVVWQGQPVVALA